MGEIGKYNTEKANQTEQKIKLFNKYIQNSTYIVTTAIKVKHALIYGKY